MSTLGHPISNIIGTKTKMQKRIQKIGFRCLVPQIETQEFEEKWHFHFPRLLIRAQSSGLAPAREEAS